jgi:hypothetical protein
LYGEYVVRITNPTDRSANVQECAFSSPIVGDPPHLPVMGIAGIPIASQRTRKVTATFLLPISKRAISALAGRQLSCTGIDWHGHEPI